MERWSGRVALVTGASSGIGAEICRTLVKNGMNVVGCARDVDKIKAISEEQEIKLAIGNLSAVKCDLTKEIEILEVFKFIKSKFGSIDVCINNAGFNLDCPLLSGETEKWRSIFEVNVLAPCICTREAIQLMKEKNIDDGHIINISSTGGHRVISTASYYCGTKFMLNALTEGLRQELRAVKSHIRSTVISPGAVETEFFYRMSGGNKEVERAFLSRYTCLKAEDIASAVVAVLQTPPHVDVGIFLIRPTEQPL